MRRRCPPHQPKEQAAFIGAGAVLLVPFGEITSNWNEPLSGPPVVSSVASTSSAGDGSDSLG